MRIIYATKTGDTFSINQLQIKNGSRYHSTMASGISWPDLSKELRIARKKANLLNRRGNWIWAPVSQFGIISKYNQGFVEV
jgi:hypothetical protein